LFDSYGSDAVRYWAVGARPGVDTAFSEDQMKVGRKLATKLLNVSKFVLGIGEVADVVIPTEAIDVAMLHRLAGVVDEATKAFEEFDYARVLERTEEFFWWFCDDYVELVKTRGYLSHSEDGAMSARAALRRALSTLQRLLAPLLPFVTEEVWNWWQSGSVHQSQWPTTSELTLGLASGPNDELLDAICGAIGVIRRAKTEAKVSQRAVVTEALFVTSIDAASAITAGWADIADAGSVEKWSISTADTNEITVNVTLAPNIQQD
jgi:valyl-tRNA synthetase